MQMLTVTIPASGIAPIIPRDPVVQRNASFQTLVIGSAAHTLHVGDSTVSATLGVPIAANGAPLVIPTAVLTQNANGWYVFGTAADVVSVLLLE
jgi:hypothetical protein